MRNTRNDVIHSQRPRGHALLRMAAHAWVVMTAFVVVGCGNSQGEAVATKTEFHGSTIVCTDGATRCLGLGYVDVCTANAWKTEPCGDAVCEDGLCRARVCEADTLACRPGGLAACSARGTSYLPPTPCALGMSCHDGACLKDACTADERVCAGNGVAICRADGSGFDVADCGNDATCVVGYDKVAQCQPRVCKPSALTCKGGQLVRCDSKGLSQVMEIDCAASGKTCEAGACLSLTCEPGAVTCMGGGVGTCAADGMNWNKQGCEAGHGCLEGGCKAMACVGGESFCDGDAPASCHADGFAFDLGAACGVGQSCKQGACVGEVVACGDGLCDGDEAANCVADCGQIGFTPSGFDVIKAGTPTALPRAPRALLAKAPAPWTAGRAIALHAGKLFTVDVDNGTLVVIDSATMKVEATVPVGQRPDVVVVGPDGTVWVSVRHESKLAKLAWGSWATGAPSFVKVGFDPTGMAMSADGKVLYVALGGEDAVIGIDPKSGKEVVRFAGVVRPRTLLVRGDGSLFVLSGGGQGFVGTVLQDQLYAKIDSVPNGAQFEVTLGTLTPANLRVANPVAVCRSQMTMEVRFANRALSATIMPESDMVLVSHVLALPGSADDVLDGAGILPVDVPQPPKMVCTGGYGSTCKIIPPPPGKPPCVGAPARPYEVSVSPMSFSKTGTLNTTLAPVIITDMPIVDDESGRSFLARFDQPTDIAHHPTHTLAFVAARGTNNVLVLNTAAADPMRWPIADIAVGAGPRAIAFAPNGDTAYVLCGEGFEVHAIDLKPLLAAASALDVPTDANLLPTMKPMLLGSTAKVSYGSDPLPAGAQLGRKIFHFARNPRLSASGRFACATCHFEGMEDKTVWFIAEGPRQTPALAGRLHDTAPYNWLGTKIKLSDNVQNTTARMGGAGLMPAELESLGAFLVQGLVPPPNPNVDPNGLTELQLAGKAIFNDAKSECTTCHVPGSLTDGAQHDVGTATDVEKKVAVATGKPAPIYNTPSLRGLFYTAPYLHDGSAKTLADALKKTATTMGHTDHLSPSQLDALVAYLKTL